MERVGSTRGLFRLRVWDGWGFLFVVGLGETLFVMVGWDGICFSCWRPVDCFWRSCACLRAVWPGLLFKRRGPPLFGVLVVGQ
jgi:hypothetical protein